MVHFCPSCWREVQAQKVCPGCGADLEAWSRASYEKKLIRALRHPEPTVPVRAAAILGERGTASAVEPLIEAAKSSRDPYLQEAAVEALGRLGDARARSTLEALSRDAPLRVRLAAQRALVRLDRPNKPDKDSEES